MTSRPQIPEQYRSTAAQLADQDWTGPVLTGSGHLAWTSPEGATVVTAATPSDHRGVKEFIADLRRNGAVIDGRSGSRKEEEQRPGPVPSPAAETTPRC